jgi:hypothetical protein
MAHAPGETTKIKTTISKSVVAALQSARLRDMIIRAFYNRRDRTGWFGGPPREPDAPGNLGLAPAASDERPIGDALVSSDGHGAYLADKGFAGGHNDPSQTGYGRMQRVGPGKTLAS